MIFVTSFIALALSLACGVFMGWLIFKIVDYLAEKKFGGKK